jgi:hypothetical protein
MRRLATHSVFLLTNGAGWLVVPLAPTSPLTLSLTPRLPIWA